MTKYVVFENPPEPDGIVEAASSDAAIREHIRVSLANGGNGDGQFVATPARSWEPRSVKTERTVRIG